MIITVIATGFDSETYHDHEVSLTGETSHESGTEVDDEVVEGIDLELSKQSGATDFTAEQENNIWDQPAEDEADEDDTPAFLRRRKKNKEE